MTISLRVLPPVDQSEPLLRELLGDILRRKRSERGRTLREVADDARMSLAYVSEVERGRKEPSSEILNALCGALDITILDLVGDAHRELEAQSAPTAPARSGGPLALAA